MALKRSDMVAVSQTAAVFSLMPDPGESILVKDIQIVPTVAVTQYLTIRTGRKTTGFFHIGVGALNQLGFQYASSANRTIMNFLQSKGINLTFPVADGETITFTATANWTVLIIKYEVYDANDIKSEQINGSKSDEFLFLNYGTNTATIAAAGTTHLIGTHNPVEFPAFPFGEIVPAKTKITCLGIGFPDVTRSGAAFATNSCYTSRLQLIREREVMFDASLQGLWVMGLAGGGTANNTTYYLLGNSQLGYSSQTFFSPLFLFDKPIEFDSGEELGVYVSTLLFGAGGTIEIASIYCCMLLNIKRTA